MGRQKTLLGLLGLRWRLWHKLLLTELTLPCLVLPSRVLP